MAPLDSSTPYDAPCGARVATPDEMRRMAERVLAIRLGYWRAIGGERAAELARCADGAADAPARRALP